MFKAARNFFLRVALQLVVIVGGGFLLYHLIATEAPKALNRMLAAQVQVGVSARW